MQENYISLDPSNAESMSSQQRSRVWQQRVQEACGGEAGRALATQVGVTTMLCCYTMMRGRGFRVMPFGASKLPGVGGIVLSGGLGYGFGSSYAGRALGNSEQYYYLISNRRSIVSGNASFDMP